MSLSYHSEHLAWQQRVKQEQSRTSQFYKTFGAYSTIDSTQNLCRPLFPNADQHAKPVNYKTFRYNLGYTYGGTKHISHALADDSLSRTSSFSPQKSVIRIRKEISGSPEKIRHHSSSPNKIRSRRIDRIQEESPKLDLEKELKDAQAKAGTSDFAAEKYIKELEERLKAERKQRIKTEVKIMQLKKT
mmetsp:Transcript_29232/g.28973  ORF Transcript_29232/g.28973 Transcript_29232/m.28973 type:complete len:188 (-) Transcript_29232:31-594(-)